MNHIELLRFTHKIFEKIFKENDLELDMYSK